MAENPADLVVAWTLREIAEHVSHVDAYAEEVGRLM